MSSTQAITEEIVHYATCPWVGLAVMFVATLSFIYLFHRRQREELNRGIDLQRSQLDGMSMALDKAEAEILCMAKGGKDLADENQRLQVELVNAHLEIGRLQLPPNPGGHYDYGHDEVWC